MAGMLRCKDEKELEALLKGSHMRVRQPGGVRFVPEQPLVEVDARGHPKREPVVSQPKVASEIEELLALQISAVGNLPAPEREFKCLSDRKIRLDFAWPAWRIACEVQGMAHRIKERFESDIKRRNLLLQNGWRVFEVSGKMVRSGEAIALLQGVFLHGVGIGLGAQENHRDDGVGQKHIGAD